MAYQNLGTVAWGSSPDITAVIDYDYRRSGADMQYKVKITVNKLPYSTSYFGYPIYAAIKLDGECKVGTHQIKAASPSQWTAALVYETDWLTVSGKSSGTTALRVNLYSGSGESRNITYPYSLYVVPAASAMSFASFTMGSAGKMTVTRANNDYTHTVSYRFGNSSGTVAEKTAAASISWTPPIELAGQIPDAPSGTGALTIDTYNGNTKIGSKEYPFTLYVPSSIQPTVDVTIGVENDNVAIDRWGVCVKGFSRLSYTVTATGAYGASIRGCQFSFADMTATGLSGTVEVNHAGRFTPSVKVTDSRGRSVTVTGDEITVYDYNEPTIGQLTVQRCNANGIRQNEGTYARVQGVFDVGASVGGHNSAVVRCRYREIDGSWSGYTTFSDGSVVMGGNLLATKTYEMEIAVADSIGGTKTVSMIIPTAEVAFHLREGGKGAAFGKYAEKDALECAWDVEIKGKPLLDWIYPVGAVYLSVYAADPSTLFGGTWERIKDKFLLSAGDTYAAGSTGGEADVSLTADNIPNIMSKYVFEGAENETGTTAIRVCKTVGTENAYTGSFKGRNLPHNNMPPYLTVYMWKRTA